MDAVEYFLFFLTTVYGIPIIKMPIEEKHKFVWISC